MPSERATPDSGATTTDDAAPNVIVCDLDGTLANIDHRLHHIRERRKDWDAFFGASGEDLPIRNTIRLVQRLHEVGHEVVIVSGRSDQVRETTETWLRRHGVPYDRLIMRRDGDRRPDTVVKAEMIERNGLHPDDVLMVLDDRARVVAMWRELGFHTFQVAEGDF